MYTATSIDVFIAAFSGAMGGWTYNQKHVVKNPAFYNRLCLQALAFAEQFDTQYASVMPNELQLEDIKACVNEYWNTYQPPGGPRAITAASYTDAVQNIIDLLTQSDLVVAANVTNPIPVPVPVATAVFELATTIGASDSLYATIPSTAVAAVVDGVVAKGDGGGGTWFWDPTSAATHNIGTIVDPTGHVGNGRWIRIWGGPMLLEWFGALTFDLSLALNAAIQALPSAGGTIDMRGVAAGAYTVLSTVVVDRPVELLKGKQVTMTATATPMFSVRNNFRFAGDDRIGAITSANNGILFNVVGGAFPAGTAEPFIELSKLDLVGAGASICVETSGVAPGQFAEGRFLVDDCRVTSFGTVAFHLAASFYWDLFTGNYFVGNNVSIIIDSSSNTEIDRNQFLGGNGEQVRLTGFGYKITNNDILGSSTFPGVPDFLIYPTVDGAEGGFGIIAHNNFFGENEGFNPLRTRIEINYSLAPNNTCPPTNCVGNVFIGPSQRVVDSATILAGVVTAHCTTPHGIPIGMSADLNLVSCDPLVYNGKFTVTATSATEFTYSSTRAAGAVVALFLVGGDSISCIRLSNPPARWLFDDNSFNLYGTLVDDIQDVDPTSTVTGTGACVWGAGNRATPPFLCSYRVFRNGGRGFEYIAPPGAGDANTLSNQPVFNGDRLAVQNSLVRSEDQSNAAWAKIAGVTVTLGQTDPWGTTRAALISADGVAIAQSILQTYAPPSSTQFYTFWAKQGSVADGDMGDVIQVGLYDLNDNKFVNEAERFRLSTSWKKYTFRVTGINLGHTNQFKIFLGGGNVVRSSFYLAFPQACDAQSSGYVNTGAAAIALTSTSLLPVAGSPEGVLIASPGAIAYDVTNGLLYVKNTGAGNTGWLKAPLSTLIANADIAAAAAIAVTKLANGTDGQQLTTIGTTPTWLGITTQDLADASPTIVVGGGNQAILPAATLTGNQTVTLGTAGAVANESITIVRLDATAHTLAIVNGGPGAGTLYTFPVSVKRQATFTFNGTDWVMVSTVGIA